MNKDTLKKIEQWHITRNTISGSTLPNQMLKLSEEMGELSASVARLKKDKIKYRHEAMDALGDIFVVMVGIALHLDCNISDCIESAYNEIKDRKGKMVNGIFIKEGE